MSFVRFEVDKEKMKKYGVYGRRLQQSQRHALESMAREWHATYLPLHFLESAYARYGYYKRKGMGMDPSARGYSRQYAARKLRQMKHNRPLVFSGEGEMQSRVLKLRSTSKMAKVVLPSKFNYKHPKSRIVMRDELTKVLPEEMQALVKVGQKAFREAVAAPRAEGF